MGKKFARHLIISLVSCILMPISFHFEWAWVFIVSCLAFIISTAIFTNICEDSEVVKYGIWGDKRGPDPLFWYEPGDKEYEEEKYYQELFEPDGAEKYAPKPKKRKKKKTKKRGH